MAEHDDDKQPTKPAPPRKKGGLTYLGTAPADDPIYRGGWNFLSGKNLKPTDDEPPKSAA